MSELKGLVEVRARCQAARGGAGSVSGEGRPLLKVKFRCGIVSTLLGVHFDVSLFEVHVPCIGDDTSRCVAHRSMYVGHTFDSAGNMSYSWTYVWARWPQPQKLRVVTHPRMYDMWPTPVQACHGVSDSCSAVWYATGDTMACDFRT